MSSFAEKVAKKAKENYENSPEYEYEQNCKNLKKELIKTYGKRIAKVLKILTTIKKHDPVLWDSMEFSEFFTDAMSHGFGYFQYEEEPMLGNRAGGFCGEYDFQITAKEVRLRDKPPGPYGGWFSYNHAKDFPKEFENYEQRLFALCKEKYGEIPD